MKEIFNFESTPDGLVRAIQLTLSLRAAGFTTHLGSTRLGPTKLYMLVAKPKVRPNRKARGCGL